MGWSTSLKVPGQEHECLAHERDGEYTDHYSGVRIDLGRKEISQMRMHDPVVWFGSFREHDIQMSLD